MSYLELWNERIEDTSNEEKFKEYVSYYYQLEKEAYNRILEAYPENAEFLSGTAKDMAEKLGFPNKDMEIFVGFIDGIGGSLTEEVDASLIEDETEISLAIDYEKLYWNMLDAQAEWLYKLPGWEKVLTKEQREVITKDFRTSKIVRREKIGRNDPCPCGSGKKYKQCCINKNDE